MCNNFKKKKTYQSIDRSLVFHQTHDPPEIPEVGGKAPPPGIS